MLKQCLHSFESFKPHFFEQFFRIDENFKNLFLSDIWPKNGWEKEGGRKDGKG